MNLKDSQNYLVNKNLLEKLVDASSISSEDLVLDIGAGKGIITEILAKTAKKVLAIEADRSLIYTLENIKKINQNVEIINKNFLEIPLPENDYKVFSNIPFNITSDIVNKLYFEGPPPDVSYLIIQKEAALRFLGEGEGTMLSLLLRPLYDLSIQNGFLN